MASGPEPILEWAREEVAPLEVTSRMAPPGPPRGAEGGCSDRATSAVEPDTVWAVEEELSKLLGTPATTTEVMAALLQAAPPAVLDECSVDTRQVLLLAPKRGGSPVGIIGRPWATSAASSGRTGMREDHPSGDGPHSSPPLRAASIYGFSAVSTTVRRSLPPA